MTEIMKLKVCGMKYQDNINQVVALQPDYLGFIFYEKSPRHFDTIIPEFPDSIKKVGVFVDESIEFILEKIESHHLNTVQLHGNESPKFCKQLKAICHSVPIAIGKSEESLEIIKVFSIKDEFNFGVLKPYEDVCDYFLFDTKGKLPGGNGYAFDWNVLNNYPSTKPFFLSGGIGLDQIENIKSFLKSEASKYCRVIDVNSKFEIEPGLKNIEDLKEFKMNLSFRPDNYRD